MFKVENKLMYNKDVSSKNFNLAKGNNIIYWENEIVVSELFYTVFYILIIKLQKMFYQN